MLTPEQQAQRNARRRAEESVCHPFHPLHPEHKPGDLCPYLQHGMLDPACKHEVLTVPFHDESGSTARLFRRHRDSYSTPVPSLPRTLEFDLREFDIP